MGANARQVDHEGHNLLHFAVSCRKEFCPPRVDIFKALLAADLGASSREATSQDEDMAGAKNEENAKNMRDATTSMLDSAWDETVDTRAQTRNERNPYLSQCARLHLSPEIY